MDKIVKAVIYKKTDWKESSYIFQCFSDCLGFCSFIAKGVKKDKKSSNEALQLFNQAELVLSVSETSDLAILKSVSVLKHNSNNNFKTLAVKSATMEFLTHLIINHDESQDIYAYITRFFDYLDTIEEKQFLHFIRFIYNLVEKISQQIFLISCDYCHSEERRVIAVDEHFGYLCSKCREHVDNSTNLNGDLLRIIYDNANYWHYINEIDESPLLKEQFKQILTKQYFAHFNHKIFIKSLEMI